MFRISWKGSWLEKVAGAPKRGFRCHTFLRLRKAKIYVSIQTLPQHHQVQNVQLHSQYMIYMYIYIYTFPTQGSIHTYRYDYNSHATLYYCIDLLLQGGSLPVISRVTTPLEGIITPVTHL